MIENNGGRTPVAKSRQLATGQVWAESDGEGLDSRFIIEIPIQQDAELLKKWG